MSKRNVVRRLAAVLVADAVGYSRLMGIDELATHRHFTADLDEVFRPRLNAHRGRLIKTTGDGFHAEFSSVVDAVECAAAMQAALATRGGVESDQGKMPYRMGINVGDIIADRGDIYGDDVNIAVRLESLAEPGAIYVTGNVARHVRGKVKYGFDDLGEHRFKNIADAIRVFRLSPLPATRPSTAAEAAPSSTTMTGTAGLTRGGAFNRPAIVVLPFENLSRDPTQEYFCDGLTTDITTDLSRFNDILVIAAHSAFMYKSRPVKIQEVARDLQVDYVLEGTVQRIADNLRVNAQLVEASSGRHIWAQRYSRKLGDLFVLQDELIREIVTTLAVKVSASELERTLRKHPGNLNAYDAVLKARQLFSTESAAAMAESVAAYEQATRLDPGYARAWADLAYSLVSMMTYGYADKTILARAEAAATKAIQLDPADYSSHASLGYLKLKSGDFERSIAEYELALQLNANDPDLLVDSAEALVMVGRHGAAVDRIKQAMMRNPHVPDWYRWNLAWALYFARDYAASLAEVERMLRPNPHVKLLKAASLVRLGDIASATKTLEAFRAQRADWSIERERQAFSFARGDDRDHWLDALRIAGLPEAVS